MGEDGENEEAEHEEESGVLNTFRVNGRHMQTAKDFYSIEGRASQRQSRRRGYVQRCGSTHRNTCTTERAK